MYIFLDGRNEKYEAGVAGCDRQHGLLGGCSRTLGNTQLQHSTISHLLGNNVNKCDYWCGSFYYLFSPHREAAAGAGKHTQNTDRGDPPSHGHWTLARNNTTAMEHWRSWSLFQWGSNFSFWQYLFYSFKRAVASLCHAVVECAVDNIGWCTTELWCRVFLLLQALSFRSDKLNYFSIFFQPWLLRRIAYAREPQAWTSLVYIFWCFRCVLDILCACL